MTIPRRKSELGAALFESAVNIALVMIVALAAVSNLGHAIAKQYCHLILPGMEVVAIHFWTEYDAQEHHCYKRMADDDFGWGQPEALDPYW